MTTVVYEIVHFWNRFIVCSCWNFGNKWNHFNFHYEHRIRKKFYTTLWKLVCWHKVIQVSCLSVSSISTIILCTIILCTKIIVNIKHGFPSCCCCFFKFLVELYHLHNFSKWISVINKCMDENASFLTLKHLFTFRTNVRKHLLRDICKGKQIYSYHNEITWKSRACCLGFFAVQFILCFSRFLGCLS